MRMMSVGLAKVVADLHAAGKLGGILGMGGGGGTSIATTAMRSLPTGVPKLMVSTMAAGDIASYVGTRDITMMPSVVDVAGINSISRRIYTNAAAAMIGMVRQTTEVVTTSEAQEEKPLITASMFGNTTPCVTHARELLEGKGYEVLVFHATGTGGRTMEGLIADGYITANLDLTTTELADEVCGGILSAGPERMMAAARSGVPTVIAPGCVDMANFGARAEIPQKYRRSRLLYEWNPNVTLLRTNVEENRAIGEMIARAAKHLQRPGRGSASRCEACLNSTVRAVRSGIRKRMGHVSPQLKKISALTFQSSKWITTSMILRLQKKQWRYCWICHHHL